VGRPAAAACGGAAAATSQLSAYGHQRCPQVCLLVLLTKQTAASLLHIVSFCKMEGPEPHSKARGGRRCSRQAAAATPSTAGGSRRGSGSNKHQLTKQLLMKKVLQARIMRVRPRTSTAGYDREPQQGLNGRDDSPHLAAGIAHSSTAGETHSQRFGQQRRLLLMDWLLQRQTCQHMHSGGSSCYSSSSR